MEANLAVPAKQAEKAVDPGFTPIQLKVAELLGRNVSRVAIAGRLESEILSAFQRTNHSPRRRRVAAMRRIRHWQKQKMFRDLVHQFAIERLDTRTPAILEGVADRAENGRVDAAKFAMEVAGRYTPKGHDTPTAVTIAINGVPRPMAIAAPPGDVIEATEYVEETDGLDGPGL